jgi:hypothetical protein
MEALATIRAAIPKYRSAENLVLHSAKSPPGLAIIANHFLHSISRAPKRAPTSPTRVAQPMSVAEATLSHCSAGSCPLYAPDRSCYCFRSTINRLTPGTPRIKATTKLIAANQAYSSRSSLHPILNHKACPRRAWMLRDRFPSFAPLKLPPSPMRIFARRVGPDALKPER